MLFYLKVNLSVLPRAKLFKGKKLLGDYDIKVEQVRFMKPVISITSTYGDKKKIELIFSVLM